MWSEMLTPPATNTVAGVGGSAEKRVFFRTAGPPVLTATPDGVPQFLAAMPEHPAGDARPALDDGLSVVVEPPRLRE